MSEEIKNTEKHSMLDFNNGFDNHKSVISTCLFGERNRKVNASIIIPAYKRQELLKKTVKSAISQTYSSEYEVIIVDNTDDDTYIDFVCWLKELNDKHIIYYHNESNIGMFGNWNRGIYLANGKWIVILNSDDLLDKKYLECMMDCMRKSPKGTSLICCNHYDMVDGSIHKELNSLKNSLKRKIIGNKAIMVKPSDMYFGSYISLIGALINKRYAINVGGFRESYYPTSDYVFMMNCSFMGYKIFHLQKNLAVYRIEANESLNYKTVELFLRHQDEAKRVIQRIKKYLPNTVAERFRNVSLYVLEKKLAEKWLGKDSINELSLSKLNKELNIKMPTRIELLCFRLFEKLKYWDYILFRKNFRVSTCLETQDK